MSAQDVFGQADALMRRHRSFVARPAGETPTAPPEPAPPEDAGIPVLTDIVAEEAYSSRSVVSILDALCEEIDSAAAAWLADALPAAVANASQQILDELDFQARHALLPRLQAIITRHRDEAGQDQSL